MNASFKEHKPFKRGLPGVYEAEMVYVSAPETSTTLKYVASGTRKNGETVSQEFEFSYEIDNGEVETSFEFQQGRRVASLEDSDYDDEAFKRWLVETLGAENPEVIKDINSNDGETHFNGNENTRKVLSVTNPRPDYDVFYNNNSGYRYQYRAANLYNANDAAKRGLIGAHWVKVSYYRKVFGPINDLVNDKTGTTYNFSKGRGLIKSEWDGKDNSGNLAREGSYFAKLAVDEPFIKFVFPGLDAGFKVSNKFCLPYSNWANRRWAKLDFRAIAHIFDGHVYSAPPHPYMWTDWEYNYNGPNWKALGFPKPYTVTTTGSLNHIDDTFGRWNPVYQIKRPTIAAYSRPFNEQSEYHNDFPGVRQLLRSQKSRRILSDLAKIANAIYHHPNRVSYGKSSDPGYWMPVVFKTDPVRVVWVNIFPYVRVPGSASRNTDTRTMFPLNREQFPYEDRL